MFNFFLIFFWALQYFNPALLENASVWIVKVNKTVDVQNVYLVALLPSHQNQQSVRTCETTNGHDVTFSEDLGELKSGNYYRSYKQQISKIKGVKDDLRTEYGTDKIVGGIQVDINEYPYHVAYGTNCGGAIIGDKWVITAGHCGKKPYIRVGSRFLNQGNKVGVKRSYIHPMWSQINKEHPFDYDYQLLELNEPLKYDENVQPIQLARMEDMVVGTILTVTGWGHTIEHGTYSPILRAVRVPIVSKEECQKVNFPYFRGTLTLRMFCAGYYGGGQDACQGDSGGPAAANDRLYGLISFGYGCATPASYGVYSKVARVQDWVQAITGIQMD